MGITFHIGDWVVYPLHGLGRIDRLLTRVVAGVPQHFYQIALEKPGGTVLVPVSAARALGLRRALLASEVQWIVTCLQQAATRPLQRRHSADHYAWCKERLRQGDVLGLAEVQRFLHELQRVEGLTNPHLQRLRTYVCKQLSMEIAYALDCPLATAQHLVATALTTGSPVALPLPAATAESPLLRAAEPIGSDQHE
jgi:CarD family transcriptional regulator